MGTKNGNHNTCAEKLMYAIKDVRSRQVLLLFLMNKSKKKIIVFVYYYKQSCYIKRNPNKKKKKKKNQAHMRLTIKNEKILKFCVCKRKLILELDTQIVCNILCTKNVT